MIPLGAPRPHQGPVIFSTVADAAVYHKLSTSSAMSGMLWQRER